MSRIQKHEDFYQRLRRRIRSWLERKGAGYRYADVLLVGPDLFHLLCRLTFDARVPLKEKAQLATAIAYFVSPIDLMPEGLVGPIGYVDDIALSAYVLHRLLKSTGSRVLEEHWAGEGTALKAIEGVLEAADAALSTGLWRRIKSVFRHNGSSKPR